MSDTTLSIIPDAFVFSMGLLIAGYATQTYLWHGYMMAMPTIGNPSTSSAFSFIIAGMFLLGTGMAYWAFLRGIGAVVE